MMINSLDYFASLVRQENCIPLFETALAIAQHAHPQLDISESQSEIDLLATKLNKRLSPDTPQLQKLRILNQFFYGELGFLGNINNYYDPDNSYLHRVIATRRGIPISLAIIYMELADQIGLSIEGVSFPGHFLMKLRTQSGDIILDPFNGTSLTRENLEERLEPYIEQHDMTSKMELPGYLHSAHTREILMRMLHNLKALFIENRNWLHLLGIQERLVILCPEDISERRDRGLAFANLAFPQAALQDIEAYLAARPYSQDAELLRQKLSELRDAARRSP